MQLRCLSRFSNGDVAYQPGQVFTVPNAQGELLIRCSPDSFELVQPEPPAPRPDLAAMSSEMGNGLTAPDRMQRGGGRRGGHG